MKTVFKISFITLLLGWLPFMFLCMWGSKQSDGIKLAIVCLGLFLCAVSALCFVVFINDRGFWLRNEILDREIDGYREAKKEYEKAKNILAKAVINYTNGGGELTVNTNEVFGKNDSRGN